MVLLVLNEMSLCGNDDLFDEIVIDLQCSHSFGMEEIDIENEFKEIEEWNDREYRSNSDSVYSKHCIN